MWFQIYFLWTLLYIQIGYNIWGRINKPEVWHSYYLKYALYNIRIVWLLEKRWVKCIDKEGDYVEKHICCVV